MRPNIFGRKKFVIATKFGITFEGVSGKAEAMQAQLNDSLTRLGTDYIDLYYMHRMDPNTPIEETMAALVELKVVILKIDSNPILILIPFLNP